MSLLESSKELLRSSAYADLEIMCGERVWNCHRAILCLRNSFFKALCGTAFVEAETKKVSLPDDDPEAVEILLVYLYTMEIPAFPDFLEAVKTAVIANKYDVKELERAATMGMGRKASQTIAKWESLTAEERNRWPGYAENYGQITRNHPQDTFYKLLSHMFAKVVHHMTNPEIQQLVAIDDSLTYYIVQKLGTMYHEQNKLLTKEVKGREEVQKELAKVSTDYHEQNKLLTKEVENREEVYEELVKLSKVYHDQLNSHEYCENDVRGLRRTHARLCKEIEKLRSRC